jgi:hypothetical protein
MRLEVNPRLKAVTCCIAISSLLLSACASSPTVSSGGSTPTPSNAPMPIDTTHLPRLMLPGATMAEVKSLAMGAARSRGWMIRYADSTNDRVVVGRPADPSVLALAAPGMGSVPGSTLEVTTLLKDYGGGIEVATLAEVVTPTQAGRPAARIDYTEQFRDTLMQSLDSLRERWTRDRERLARAAPPPEGWKDAWDDSPKPPSQPACQPPTAPRRRKPRRRRLWPPHQHRHQRTPPRVDASQPRCHASPTQAESAFRGPPIEDPRPNPDTARPGAAPVIDASSNPNRLPDARAPGRRPARTT